MFNPKTLKSVPDDLGERICKTLQATDVLLTQHTEGRIDDFAEHARQLRNLQSEVSALVTELGLRRGK